MGGTVTAVTMPFEGLPASVRVLFAVVFVLVLAMLVWTTVLFAVSRRALRDAPPRRPAPDDEFLWVFLVPALNEEVTIHDSVHRLLAVEARHTLVVVIDDGSTDGTRAILDGIEDPRLHVVRREPPDARLGKAAALNAGWHALDTLLGRDGLSSWPREQIVVGIIDADGRLDPTAPRYLAPHFADERVGGLQVLVRIYNRGRLLTWLQDVEFSVYGLLYQAGRTPFGVAAMGGNGQFNRLAALDAIADDRAGGPWHHRLTEDQDLGLRLIAAGWNSVAEARTSIDQQGLSNLGRLLRQRTRWSQGNLQAMSHVRAMAGLERAWPVRIDQVLYLLQPVAQSVVGVAFALSIALAIFDVADFWGSGDWWQLAFFLVLGFGGVIFGCIAWGLRRGPIGVLAGVAITPVFAAYSWLIWPVLARSAARQLTGREGWAKTSREPVERTRSTSST